MGLLAHVFEPLWHQVGGWKVCTAWFGSNGRQGALRSGSFGLRVRKLWIEHPSSRLGLEDHGVERTAMEGVDGFLENDTLVVAFALSFRLYAVVARWLALVALDPPLSTC